MTDLVTSLRKQIADLEARNEALTIAAIPAQVRERETEHQHADHLAALSNLRWVVDTAGVNLDQAIARAPHLFAIPVALATFHQQWCNEHASGDAQLRRDLATVTKHRDALAQENRALKQRLARQ